MKTKLTAARLLARTWLIVLLSLLALPLGAAEFSYDYKMTNSGDYSYDSSKIIMKNSAAYINSFIGVNGASGLTSLWPFDEASWTGAAGQVKDKIGTNHGQALNGLSTTTAKFGNGANITSKNHTVDIANINDANISISFWYKFNGNGGNWNTLLCWDGGSQHHLLIEKAAAHRIGYYNSAFYPSSKGLTVGEWYHLVLIKDGTAFTKIYVNSELVMNRTTNCFNNASKSFSRIGNTLSGQGSLGIIDDVAIWNRAISDSEVSEIYNAGNGLSITGVETATIQPAAAYKPGGLEFWSGFSGAPVSGNEGAIKFQLSWDDGATWYWYTGGTWSAAAATISEANDAADFTSTAMKKIFIPGGGVMTSNKSLLWRAFLHSVSGIQKVGLDDVRLTLYSQTSAALTFDDASGFSKGIRRHYASKAMDGGKLDLRVNFTDAKGGFIPKKVQFWLDTNSNGEYDTDEKYDMAEEKENLSDADYYTGVIYKLDNFAFRATNNRSGKIKYRYYADMGHLEADGEATQEFDFTYEIQLSLDKNFKVAAGPSPFNPAAGEKTRIVFDANADGSAELLIYSMSHKLVWRKVEQITQGGNFIFWDGKNARGMNVASGIYFCRVVVKPNDGMPQVYQTRIMVARR